MTYQWPSVTDFGAVGDEVTNNTAAIQAGLDAVEAMGGGTLVFPPGHFMSGPLLLPHSVVLRGSGRPPQFTYLGQSATILDFYGSPAGSDGLTPKSNAAQMVRICDMQIQRAPRHGIAGAFVYSAFERVNISYCGGEGVVMRNDASGQSWMYSMDHCLLTYNGGCGVLLTGNAVHQGTTAKFENVYCNHNAMDGIRGTNLTTATLISSAADSNGRNGFNIQNCNTVTLIGTDAEGNGWTGYYIGGSRVVCNSARGAINNSTKKPGYGNFMVIDGASVVALHNCADTVPEHVSYSTHVLNGSDLHVFGGSFVGATLTSDGGTKTVHF